MLYPWISPDGKVLLEQIVSCRISLPSDKIIVNKATTWYNKVANRLIHNDQTDRGDTMTTTKPRTHYEVMGVAKDAPMDIIHAAFKAWSKMFSGPDGSADGRDAEEYKLITAAWSVLKDTGRRKEYDESLGGSVTAGEDLRDAVFTDLSDPMPDPDDELDPADVTGAVPKQAAYTGSAWATPLVPLFHPLRYVHACMLPMLHPLRWFHLQETGIKVLLVFMGLMLTTAFCMITSEVGPHGDWVIAFDLLHFVEKLVWIVGRIIHAFGVFF
jgi:hypothetical protein